VHFGGLYCIITLQGMVQKHKILQGLRVRGNIKMDS